MINRNVATFVSLILISTSVVMAQDIRVGTISSSINNWPLWVAQAKDLFADEGFDVEVIVTGESEHQLDMVDAEELEIFHQAADHFVREIEDGKNYVIIHTITRAANGLIVRPEYKTYKARLWPWTTCDRVLAALQKGTAKAQLEPRRLYLVTGIGWTPAQNAEGNRR